MAPNGMNKRHEMNKKKKIRTEIMNLKHEQHTFKYVNKVFGHTDALASKDDERREK